MDPRVRVSDFFLFYVDYPLRLLPRNPTVQPSIPAPDATMETVKPNVTAISSQKIITSTPEKTTATDDCLDDSATPVKPFKNLRKVDEIDAKQASTTSEEPPFIPSKSQRKRLKKAQGKSSPSPHH